VSNCRLVSSGEDKPRCASVKDDDPNDFQCRLPDLELQRKAVSYAMRAQLAETRNAKLRSVTFRLDDKASPVERQPFSGIEKPSPLAGSRPLPRGKLIPRDWRYQMRVAHRERHKVPEHATPSVPAPHPSCSRALQP